MEGSHIDAELEAHNLMGPSSDHEVAENTSHRSFLQKLYPKGGSLVHGRKDWSAEMLPMWIAYLRKHRRKASTSEREPENSNRLSRGVPLNESDDDTEYKVLGPYQDAWDHHQRVHPAYWSVDLDDLKHFRKKVKDAHARGEILQHPDHPNPNHDNANIGPSLHSVSQYVIQPVTIQKGAYRSWALMRHKDGLPCHGLGGDAVSRSLTFVSHNWLEGVYEFLLKMTAYINNTDAFWICFLANPQAWQPEDLTELLGDRPWRSPFARALKYADTFYIVPNSTESVYRRLWCCFEICMAIDLGLHGLVGYAKTDVILARVPGITSDRVAAKTVRQFLENNEDISIKAAWSKGLVPKASPDALTEDETFHDYEFAGRWITGHGLRLGLKFPGGVAPSFAFLCKRGGRELARTEFTTIRDAKCSNDHDASNIWGLISESVDRIDATIRRLIEHGEF